MNGRALVLAAIGAFLLLMSTWAIHKTELPSEQLMVIAGSCRLPVTVIEPTQRETQHAAIVFHGLAANRRVMRVFGESLAAEDDVRTYLVDLPGHGDNTDAFSFPRAGDCAAAFVEKLARDGRIDPRETAVAGHSMGAAIAIRLADRVPVAATVALSPAPMVLPRRMPANLLVFSAQYDIPPLKREAEILATAAGGDRTTMGDFAQLRAFHLEHVAKGNHHSVIVDPNVAEQCASWMEDSLDPAKAKASGFLRWTHEVEWGSSDAAPFYHAKTTLARALSARIAPVAGLVGLLLMFPLAVTIAERAQESNFPGQKPSETNTDSSAGPKPRASIQTSFSERSPARSAAGTVLVTIRPSRVLALCEGAVFAFAGVLILTFVVPLGFVHMYSADYLASLLLIFGVLLLVVNRSAARRVWSWNAREAVAGGVVGFAVMLAFGAWMNWRLADLWLPGARWWRFALLLPFCFVFSFAEEVVLGPIGPGRQRVFRFVLFLLLRFELWFAAAFAFYALGSGQALIGVLAPALAGFSILQRLGTDQIRVRTGSAVGASIFGAILAAWFIAAVYPLT
jgi:pimeloyl-ACP methyl ester carboxylesterase